MNAAFEDAAFIRGRRLFHFSLPKYGVYWRAAFKRGNMVYSVFESFAALSFVQEVHSNKSAPDGFCI